MGNLFRRKSARAADWRPAETDNLYELWVTAPTRVASRLEPHLSFTPLEVDAATLWSARQEGFGLRAVAHDADRGAASVLEVYGPDDLVPHCILYPTTAGVQSDEFSGDSKVFPCLETALQTIAPLC